MAKNGERTGHHMVQKIGKNQKIPQDWKNCDKDDILTVEENQVSLFGNNAKRVLEITPCKKKVRCKKLEGGQDAD